MAEYFKKADVFEAYSDWLSTYDIGFDCAHNLWVKLDEIPVETVVERKKGKWETAYLDHEAFGVRPTAWYCSECHQITSFRTFFCPNCGADMRGE